MKNMKKLGITLCVSLAGLSVFGYTWNISKNPKQYKGMELEINDLADQGVILHGPASAGFNSRFTALVSIADGLSNDALKYSVILENKSPQNINALCMIW